MVDILLADEVKIDVFENYRKHAAIRTPMTDQQDGFSHVRFSNCADEGDEACLDFQVALTSRNPHVPLAI